jgi:hypothetical protein
MNIVDLDIKFDPTAAGRLDAEAEAADPTKTQRIFTKAVTKLTQQNARATSEDGEFCLYRARNGHRCAAGHLIDDEHYHESLERRTSNTPGVSTALAKSWGGRLTTRQMHLIGHLQGVHDGTKVDNWGEAFAKLAKQYDLEVPS